MQGAGLWGGRARFGEAVARFGLGAAMALAGAVARGELSPALIEAMEAVRMDRPTAAQRAMLFASNADINMARLNGWITDAHYQAAQDDFARQNQEFARRAAMETGAEFRVQNSKSQVFSPGTDSDYIVKVKSSDPVGKIHDMQTRYNAYVNRYLRETLGPSGIQITERLDWHNRLDVDFMADPKYVTDAQFREIAKLNNDAYTRRNAAEFERVSRAGDGTRVTPEQFRDYALEMQDFIDKKQHKMEQFRRNPSLLNDPVHRAEYHRLMAQEQKYIERVQSANQTLRKQAGLPGQRSNFPDPYYEVTYNSRGEAVMRKRSPETLAARGSRRSPTNYGTTVAASAVADNSTRRALRELGESMAESAKKGGGWSGAADDIARLADRLPPAERGFMIENIRRKAGGQMASEVADAMRKRVGGGAAPAGGGGLKKVNDVLTRALGVSDDLRHMGKLRRSFNEAATRAMGGLDKLGKVGTAVEVASAAIQMKAYCDSISRALDPTITDEEADRHFERAHEAAKGVAIAGALGAVCEAVPPVGVIVGGWTLGYEGTRYLLTNTETGQVIDRKVFEYFDRHMQAYESAAEELTEMLGGESGRMAREEQLRKLAERYAKLLKEGRIKLKEGATAAEVLQRIREGDLWGLDELLEVTTDLGAQQGAISGYMAWYNDVGWIHVGSVEQFHAPRARGSETWGGLSKEPLVKTPMLGGRSFETLEDAMKALAGEIGGSIERRRAPLAFPKVYYQAGDKKVGFDVIGHPIFKEFKAAADAK